MKTTERSRGYAGIRVMAVGLACSIAGIVPTPIGQLTGCSFRNRCPWALPECTTTTNVLKEIAPGRAYRCLLSPEACTAEWKRS